MKIKNEVEHLKKEIYRLKRAEKLRMSREKLYRAVLEDQTEIISRFKKDGTYTFVNETYCRLFGKNADDLIGKKWHPVAHEDDVPKIEKKLELLTKKNPVVKIENRVWDAEGRLLWMQFINRGIFDQGANLSEIQSVGRDITEIKEKERLLLEHEIEIKEKSEELEKVNTALEVLLSRRNRQLEDLRENIYKTYNNLVLPDLNHLMNILELESNRKRVTLIIRNMEHLLSPDSNILSSEKFGLTKTEIKIAAMIKGGMTSLEIADMLNISPNTVGFHRKNLRKKLGIHQKDTNLHLWLKHFQ